MNSILDTILTIAVLGGILILSAVITNLFTRKTNSTMSMRDEALSAGFYEPQHYAGQRFPRIQILTIRELLEGKQLQYPRGMGQATFKQTERRGKKKVEQAELF